MPGCCAVGCRNRPEDGVRVYAFPKDKDRRKQWEVKVRRDNWEPTNHSKLCAAHFEKDQFYLDPKGNKRLKKDSVPTLFSFQANPRRRKPPKDRQMFQELSVENNHDHSYSQANFKLFNFKQNSPTILQDDFKENDDPMVGIDSLFEHSHDFNMNTVEDHDVGPGVLVDLPTLEEPDLTLQPVATEEVETCTTIKCVTQTMTKDREVANQRRLNKILRNKLKEANSKNAKLRATQKANQTRMDHQRKEMAVLRGKLWRRSKPDVLKKSQRKTSSGPSIPLLKPSSASVPPLKQRDKKKHGLRWKSCQLKKALQLRFACGSYGYSALLEQDYSLPSIRTLDRHTEKFLFKPGILHEVFGFLKIKTSAMKHHQRHSVMTLDEMTIKASRRYDVKNDEFVGDVTLPGHKGIATKALVWMLGGITTKWKQPIAYHYTPSSVNGEVFVPILNKLLHKAKEINIFVSTVVSDMGSSNLRM